ncbi:DMT family transporter [Priestia megaterium]|uniref:DMT family transporter n=1 Tax=Priestia megaterium TaxID=1404 RepID=UPI002452A830|nr:DMT family transporter [Priestia megaterium]MDH3144301.1 DMT family transporter [Priestia megaterium]MED4241014.1 DMT family transporter [Priestia megaterium]MED4255881.1 DMT family transporter [Priestia megaterium]MED4267735.1 DMT family transporter [Priestia megaterium]MED4278359.1 DMT family transporter [Priestia megaterium]
MLWFISALGTAVCFGVNNTLFKWGALQHLSKVCIQLFFYWISFFIILLFTFIKGNFELRIFPILTGALIGILNANGNIQMSKAFEKGPASITSTIIAMNTVIVVLATSLLFPQSIPLTNWVGIIIIILAACIIQYQPNKTAQVEYKLWILSCCLALLSIGTVGVIMKFSTYQHFSVGEMLVSMYGGGAVYLSFLARKELKKLTTHKIEIKIGILVGILSTIGYSCYLFALKEGPSSVVYPIISLNCIVVLIGSLIIFKERLKKYQLIGIILTLCGIVLTKI